MFGIIRPCGARLGERLRASWTAHLCGMCLALRDEHGHAARLVTNYDAVVVSALVEAQLGAAGGRRTAGACALRGMRRASVATGDGARLAAAVSLLLASAKIDDHVDDGDLTGAVRVRAARAVAGRWAAAGRTTGAAVGLDAPALLDAVGRQHTVESPGHSLLQITEPTETATGLAFAQTAVVADRPGNVAPLTEAGRLFGRLAHLLDAVEDLHDDLASGAWNPIVATGASPAHVRSLCDDALLGIRLALAEVEFVEPELVHVLLVHELRTAVHRTFTATQPGPYPPADPGAYPPGSQPGPGQAPPGWATPPPPGPPSGPARSPLTGCLGWLVACGTCQVCCAGDYADPCTGQSRRGLCRDADCCDCCEGACDGCNCLGDCGSCCSDCDCDCGCDC